MVLDIGGDIGAAIAHVPADLAGTEIEIRRGGDPWESVHTAVRGRHLGGSTILAAVFESLREGPYELRVRFGDPQGPVVPFEVVGGQVTDVAWPAP